MRMSLLLIASLVAGGLSSTEGSMVAQENQIRGYWTDPSTGLMWAGRDNGKDVSWRGAIKYCLNLRLAGYSDWKLASKLNSQGIYDRNTEAPGLAGPGKGRAATWHVKGNLFLAGNQWADNQTKDGRRCFQSYEWYFDFNEGRWNNQPSGFPDPSSFMRALCVRSSVK